jgi:protein-S-isoprenylcysteine O-methyltransferase Ste14
MTSAFIAARALLFATGFLWLWFWVIGVVQPLSRTWDAILPAWIALPGIVLIAIGAAGIVTCVALFVVRGRGTPAIFDAPRVFVAVGPYRYVRNPMYISALATFLGTGLYLRSFAVLVFVIAWLAVVHLFVVFIEEPGLHERFGGSYDDYRRHVPRWLPRNP